MELKLDYIYQGDTLKILKTFPNESIDMCITSPPYWNMRDYGEEMQLGLEETTDEFIEKLYNIFHEVQRVLKKEGFCYVTQFTYNGVCFKKVFSSQKVFEEITRVDLLKFGRSQLLDICVLVKFKKNEKGFYYAEIQDFNSNKSNKVVF